VQAQLFSAFFGTMWDSRGGTNDTSSCSADLEPSLSRQDTLKFCAQRPRHICAIMVWLRIALGCIKKRCLRLTCQGNLLAALIGPFANATHFICARDQHPGEAMPIDFACLPLILRVSGPLGTAQFAAEKSVPTTLRVWFTRPTDVSPA